MEANTMYIYKILVNVNCRKALSYNNYQSHMFLGHVDEVQHKASCFAENIHFQIGLVYCNKGFIICINKIT